MVRNMTCTVCKSIFASPKRRSYAAHLFVHLKLGKQRRTDVHDELIANGAPEIAAQKDACTRVHCHRTPETKELQRRTQMLPNAVSTHGSMHAWLWDGSLTKRPVVQLFPKAECNPCSGAARTYTKSDQKRCGGSCGQLEML